MDEMAEKLGLDPIEFRILNDTQVDPETSRSRVPSRSASWSSAFARAPSASAGTSAVRSPASVRDGRWLVGMGVAAAFRNNLRDEVGGARAARQSRRRDGRDRHDRHRHRQLHDHRADRGRDDGRAARQGRGAPRRLDLPGLGGLGRAMGREQLDLRRLCRLRQAAGGRGAEARLRLPPRPFSRTARSARAIAACRSPRPRARAASSPKMRSSSATSTRSTSNRPSARISSRSASTPQRARSACGACSRCARRAASSIPSPRAAR